MVEAFKAFLQQYNGLEGPSTSEGESTTTGGHQSCADGAENVAESTGTDEYTAEDYLSTQKGHLAKKKFHVRCMIVYMYYLVMHA